MSQDTSSERTDRGLYQKYSVTKDDEPQDGCFVLKPESDPAARAALWEYAHETNDAELAADLRAWVLSISPEEVCDCDDPDVVRTMAKGTPAERSFCSCGGLVQ